VLRYQKRILGELAGFVYKSITVII